MQDAARPVVLSLLLQKALQLSTGESNAAQASAGSLAKCEESWPVALANSVCHQVSSFSWSLALGLVFVLAGDETMTYRINHLILMRTCL